MNQFNNLEPGDKF